MKWIVSIVGFVMAVVGGVNLGATTSDRPGEQSPDVVQFSFKDAAPEEQEFWLNEAAAKLEKLGKREANGSIYVSYKETIVRVRAREIQTVLQLGAYVEFSLDQAVMANTLEKACPHYIREGLYDNNIKWTQRIVKPNGMSVMNLPISRSTCRRFLPSS